MKQIIIGIFGSMILFQVNSFLGIAGKDRGKNISKVEAHVDTLPKLKGDTLTWQITIIDSNGNMYLFNKLVNKVMTQLDSVMVIQEVHREYREMRRKD